MELDHDDSSSSFPPVLKPIHHDHEPPIENSQQPRSVRVRDTPQLLPWNQPIVLLNRLTSGHKGHGQGPKKSCDSNSDAEENIGDPDSLSAAAAPAEVGSKGSKIGRGRPKTKIPETPNAQASGRREVHQCNQCTVSFERAYNLQRHVALTHTVDQNLKFEVGIPLDSSIMTGSSESDPPPLEPTPSTSGTGFNAPARVLRSHSKPQTQKPTPTKSPSPLPLPFYASELHPHKRYTFGLNKPIYNLIKEYRESTGTCRAKLKQKRKVPFIRNARRKRKLKRLKKKKISNPSEVQILNPTISQRALNPKIIGPNDKLVNVGLGKIKMEVEDYIPPGGIKPEPLDQDEANAPGTVAIYPAASFVEEEFEIVTNGYEVVSGPLPPQLMAPTHDLINPALAPEFVPVTPNYVKIEEVDLDEGLLGDVHVDPNSTSSDPDPGDILHFADEPVYCDSGDEINEHELLGLPLALPGQSKRPISTTDRKVVAGTPVKKTKTNSSVNIQKLDYDDDYSTLQLPSNEISAEVTKEKDELTTFEIIALNKILVQENEQLVDSAHPPQLIAPNHDLINPAPAPECNFAELIEPKDEPMDFVSMETSKMELVDEDSDSSSPPVLKPIGHDPPIENSGQQRSVRDTPPLLPWNPPTVSLIRSNMESKKLSETTEDESSSRTLSAEMSAGPSTSKSFRSSLMSHRRTNAGEKPFKCKTSKQSFPHKSSRTTHLRTHIGENPFKCETCKKSFAAKIQLIIHLRTHTGEKPFKCKTCKTSFAHKSNLVTHLRTHTGEKPFKCETCKKSFSQQNTLMSHHRTHTGDKPFKCETCKKSFAQTSHLTTHLRTHTGEKPFKCQQCEKSFSRKSQLMTHLIKHTREKPFKCETCKKLFGYKWTLMTHLRTHAGKPNHRPPVSYNEEETLGEVES